MLKRVTMVLFEHNRSTHRKWVFFTAVPIMMCDDAIREAVTAYAARRARCLSTTYGTPEGKRTAGSSHINYRTLITVK